ncbi:class I SAM-dependent methyltransferase [Sulfitobacter pseudonitzschiae]|uniref:Class I SAM-dependent methyltransferase n=1 Tax=Pseudosulfitobacter pseudonitzschiae TaxID=1402135 RepID=A0A9Q2RT47_9RHOB|nr:cyclopropane-fatty-acyl-phospholipid synthase family protein [Pseudosulfitobacter pseudonitzschiae]MBM2290920.1 class I SAM-dependent methyltransferase [Pseudosulfitobacter pseudonitzschiae]MBM2295838.1 class I SAM-dependent methyltransferase [Pseudosulfitobacter pseudonitzschiae]MBM2300751.1 class I SAM-dependent methyltransferase [Pseudosulfitobacter pseudonitzschiae]MBM2310535.1 class I SAM-dependent methyltransferase [Pseudosulfitobacter pseudonitzschiae]MBM2315448.1 class I SAM-depende
MILTTTDGQTNLPRYFARVFAMTQGMNNGRVDFVLPDGRTFRAEGKNPGPVAELRIHNNDLFARLIREGDLGFCDAYLDEWWSTPDLQAFMDLVHADNDSIYDGFPGMGLVRFVERFRFWLQRNNRTQARKNISYHYDLGNEFYGLWLDDTMTYSSALFETGQESHETAQIAKYASMIDQMGAQAGDHILEIGCGWGGFAEYAAKERGIRVTGLTISEEQIKYARERIEKAGLSDMVDFKLQDYRDEKGTYDGIASIEMFEAVGEQYWPAYFNTVRERLKPGKNATLQIITVQDRRWEVYKRGVDFIQKYIFPGGMLPSPKALRDQVVKAGLSIERSIEFGPSYSISLRRWHDTFNERWDQIAAMGFDDRFRRMWNFYLTSCAATFESANCDVTQITIKRPV